MTINANTVSGILADDPIEEVEDTEEEEDEEDEYDEEDDYADYDEDDDDQDGDNAHEMELHWTVGDEETFDRVLGYILKSDPDLLGVSDESQGGGEIYVVCAYCYNPTANFDEGDYGGEYYSDYLGKFGAILLEHNRPVGWEYEYNDQGYNRAASILRYDTADFLPVTPRSQIQNRTLLIEWLRSVGEDVQALFGDWEKVETDASLAPTVSA